MSGKTTPVRCLLSGGGIRGIEKRQTNLNIMNNYFKIANNLLISYVIISIILLIDKENKLLISLFNSEVAWFIYWNINLILGLSLLFFLLFLKNNTITIDFKQFKKNNSEESMKSFDDKFTQKTTQKKYYISIIGAINVTIFFFMPWIEFDCIVKKSYSGADIGDVLWTIPISAVVFICAFVVMHKDVRNWLKLSLISLFAGLLPIMALFIKMHSISGEDKSIGTGLIQEEILKHMNIKYGIVMVIFGNFMLLLGSLIYYTGYNESFKRSRNLSINYNEDNEEIKDIEESTSDNLKHLAKDFDCLNCNSIITLEKDELSQVEFICPVCGKINKIK